jgi:putative ABC transport system ATP-binding protein
VIPVRERSGPATAGDVVLALTGLEKAFVTPAGPHRVLAGVDLTVEPGELVAVAGRSGSGKTTLLTIVTGWEQPDAGSVIVLGGAVPPDRLNWNDVAVLPQSLGLLDELTVAENVALLLRLHDVANADEPATLMRRLGIDHLANRLPNEISLGEQQRTALARAVVVRPRLVLADEPVAHQNREWAEAMMFVLRHLTDEGCACVLASHNEVAFEDADRVLELRNGELGPLSRS